MPDGFAIVVSGGLGAGKTTAATHLAARWQFEHLSFVDRIWMPILQERSIEPTRAALQSLGLELVETVGITGLVDDLLSTRTTDRFVIDDARRADVIEYLRRRVDSLVHIHLEANFETRFPRLVQRDGVQSREDQVRAEKVPTETTIADLAPIADHLIVNTEGVPHLHSQLDEIVRLR